MSQNGVSLWARKRMPLQPIGDLAEAKKSLGHYLRSLRAPEAAILSCSFTSFDDGGYDVENVLIYNIGDGAFRSASRNGIAFRKIRAAPLHPNKGTDFQYLSRYEFTEVPALDGPIVAELSFQPSTFASVFDVWWAAANAHSFQNATASGEFGLRISVGLPKKWANPGRMLKKLIDGIVCSFHADPDPDLEAIHRLSKKSGRPVGEIAARLLSPRMPILAPRHRLVSAYREHVMWNPNDELCVQCVLLPFEASELSCNVAVYAT